MDLFSFAMGLILGGARESNSGKRVYDSCIIDASVKQIPFQHSYTYAVFAYLVQMMSEDNWITITPEVFMKPLNLTCEEAVQALDELEVNKILIKYPLDVLNIANKFDPGEKTVYMINPDTARKVNDTSKIQWLWEQAESK